MIMVKSGVSEFMIPTKLLSRKRCAFVNRKEGSPLPTKPTRAIHFNFSFGTFLKPEMLMGNKTTPAISRRNAAT